VARSLDDYLVGRYQLRPVDGQAAGIGKQPSEQTVGRADPLEALAACGELRADLVREALEARDTWEEVGEAIGISRQAGWAQFWEGVQQRHLAECWAIPGPVRSAPE
jgi:hypothetical protein